jgi:multidrug efflux pump subunit AcrA (membrane-fusion protein)
MLAAACGLLSGCARPAQSAPKPTPPATVPQVAKEDKLNEITLTAEAEERLGLKTAPVEERAVRRQQTFPGEVVLPPSAVLAVSAPVSGTLEVVRGQELPRDGAVVQKGQPMFTLVPHAMTQAEQLAFRLAKLQLEQAKIDADGLVKEAQARVEGAVIARDRAKQQFDSKVGLKKDLDDADTLLQIAQEALAAANNRKKLADSLDPDTEKSAIKPLTIAAPRGGLVRATHAVAGELVPAGALLFDIMNVETVWIKVPVFVGELAAIAERDAVQVKNFAEPPASTGSAAKPVDAPPSAQAQAAAVDLYYVLANPDGKYRPGQRVSVQVPLRGEDKSLGVPWAAIVHDIYGGTWLYVQTGERKYARQRVQVDYVVGDWAVLRAGPKAGTKVVTAGAAEVFGAEFNIFK